MIFHRDIVHETLGRFTGRLIMNHYPPVMCYLYEFERGCYVFASYPGHLFRGAFDDLESASMAAYDFLAPALPGDLDKPEHEAAATYEVYLNKIVTIGVQAALSVQP